MIQNHLLQLLCLIAMDPPSDLSADSIREKVKVLKALAPIAPEHLGQQLVRGQYVASSGRQVPGYLEEENSNTQSDTETFVALRAEICNWRWAGVLSADRQAHAAEAVADRHPLQGAAALHLRPRAAPADRQQADHPPAAAGGHLAAGDDQDQGLDKGMQLRSGPLQLNFSETYKSRASPTPTSVCCWK